MFTGIAAGVFSALFMSISYVFSRAFIRKYKDPVRLSVFSQLVMTCGGLAALFTSLFFVKIPFDNGKFYLYLFGEAATFITGQTSFFILLKKVEATRASSLLGLKLIPLAVIASLLGQDLSVWQWLAIVLCSLAAAGMNLTGLAMDLKSLFWLFTSVIFYALCDICLGGLMQVIEGSNTFMKSVAGMGVCFTTLGIIALAFVVRYKPSKRELFDVIPYSFCYFSSILLLLVCFCLVGVVSGNILQSGRGIISIVLGIILLRLGWEKTEGKVPLKTWIQRLVMAFLMLCAMTLYTLTHVK